MSKKNIIDINTTIISNFSNHLSKNLTVDVNKIWTTLSDKNFRELKNVAMKNTFGFYHSSYPIEIRKTNVAEYMILIIMARIIPAFEKEMGDTKKILFSDASCSGQPDLITDNNVYEITSCGIDSFHKCDFDIYKYTALIRRKINIYSWFSNDWYNRLIHIYADYYANAVRKKMLKPYVNSNFNLVLYHAPAPLNIPFNGIESIYIYLRNNCKELHVFLNQFKNIFFITSINIYFKYKSERWHTINWKFCFNTIVSISKKSLPLGCEDFAAWQTRINSQIFYSKEIAK